MSHYKRPNQNCTTNARVGKSVRVSGGATVNVALPSDEYFSQQHHVSHTRSGGNRHRIPSCSTNHF